MQKARPPPPPPKPSKFSSQPPPIPLATKPTNSQSKAASTKRGIGWPWDQPAAQFNLWNNPGSSISWVFNWELWVPESLPKGIEWTPCVRTAQQVNDIIPFLTDISSNKNIPIRHLLGFNEPEVSSQANLSVEDGVRLWREFVLPAKRKFGCRLGSPGMSSDRPKCEPWLDGFFSSLAGEDGVDFLVLHWYGAKWTDMASFLGYMYEKYKLPIWLNEFACSKMGNGEVSEEEVAKFIAESVPWLEQQPWIERYAYYGHGQGKDVGAWVGSKNNFTSIAGPGHEDTDGRVLSTVGRLYLDS